VLRPQAQVTASEIALHGVREEARLDSEPRSTCLNAQQALVNARVRACHGRSTIAWSASYAVLTRRLGALAAGAHLATTVYDAERALSTCAAQLVAAFVAARRPLLRSRRSGEQGGRRPKLSSAAL